MNGHVFQCYGETSNKNQFNRTVEELDGYIGINLKHSEDVKKMVKKMKDTVIAMPVDRKDDASKTELKFWDEMIENYVKRIDTYAVQMIFTKVHQPIWSRTLNIFQKR